ncbi:MAG: DUF881 domain-containing protein [Chloroflexota bacterium]
MHRPFNQVSLAAVTLLLGALVVVQLRSQAGSAGLAALSAQELTVLVANLNTRNDQLRTEVATLQRQLDDLVSGQSRGETSVDRIRADLSRVSAWAGLVPVTGPGVTILLSGPVAGANVESLVNELRNAGAEGIAIAGIRVVPGTIVGGAPGGLTVDGTQIASPFSVDAIGSSTTLLGSLTRAGGIIAQLAVTNPELSLTVTPVDRVDLAATQRDLVPLNGGPRL